MAGEQVVEDGQFQLRDLLISKTGKVQWDEIAPDWWGMAPVRNTDVPRMSTHGVRGGRDLLGSKLVTGVLLVLGDDGPDLQTLLDDISAAWAPTDDDIPFVAQELGSKRRRYGRPRRSQVLTELIIKGATAKVAVEFEALDPFFYDDEEQTATTHPAQSGGGIAMPITLPMTLPASSSTGFLSAFNAGNAPAPWWAELTGPLVMPTITHAESGSQMQFNANGGLTITAGDAVTLDSKTKSVLYNGVADRRLNLLLGQGWFDLVAGGNSIGLTADSGDGSLTVHWRNTRY